MGSQKTTQKLLRELIPDFCYQTAHEILTMIEQIDEDVPPESVKVLLSKLHTSGFLISRPVKMTIHKVGVRPREYIRVNAIAEVRKLLSVL